MTKTNASVGFLIGFKADVIDDAPEILRRGDVSSRLGTNNYQDLPHLPHVSDVKTFVNELLKSLTMQKQVEDHIVEHNLDTEHGIFPFEHSAYEILADYAASEPTKTLPRYIINAINECAIQAWDEQKFLVDENIVNSVAPFAFG